VAAYKKKLQGFFAGLRTRLLWVTLGMDKRTIRAKVREDTGRKVAIAQPMEMRILVWWP
jgi:hypothetical protein